MDGIFQESRAAHPLFRQREIIDRRALREELESTGSKGADSALATTKIVAILQRHLIHGQTEIRRRFDQIPQTRDVGRQAGREMRFLVDQLIRALYDFTIERVYPSANPSAGESVTLVAVGGYGRGMLAPFSDIDLLFLLPYKMTAYCEQIIEYILYRLWDLGLKVNQSARSIEECLRQSKADLTIETSLLEARYLWGDQELYKQFSQRFLTKIIHGHEEEFYKAKIAERERRHMKFGASRYALEPNIKEGKGGLRDLQTLGWIFRFAREARKAQASLELLTPAERHVLDRVEAFYWKLRFHLHYTCHRAEEKLTFDNQVEIAHRLGYRDRSTEKGVERLMRHYFLHARQVGLISQAFQAALEQELTRGQIASIVEREGFVIEGGRLSVKSIDRFHEKPSDLLRIFRVAQKHRLDIHPLAFSWIEQASRTLGHSLRDNKDANALFLEILTDPEGSEATLRQMNEVGLFGRFMPEFGRIVAQMQFDMYHHYTVDEHTIFAIGILQRIEKGELAEEAPIASRVVHQILSRRVLYLATLFHDIAKGRGGDHSIIGAELAEEICQRLKLDPEEIETIAWLVRHHLLLSNTAFRRDIDDSQTIETIADIIQSVERLRLLLVLTVADIRAVGPKTWNGWKAQLLRGLYERIERYLSGGLAAADGKAEIQNILNQMRQNLADWKETEWQAYLDRGRDPYWLSFPIPTLLRQAQLMRQAAENGKTLSIDYHIDAEGSMTEVTIYTPDRTGLFSQLAGAFSLAGANIVEARIFTLKNGYALDVFTIQDSENRSFDQKSSLSRLSSMIERVLNAPTETLAHLRRRPPHADPSIRAFPVVARILIDNNASAAHTMIEVTGRDRRGLLHYLTNALTEQNLKIANAKISTFGHRAVDTFYLKDQFGLKIENEARLKAIREALSTILEEGENLIGPSFVPSAATPSPTLVIGSREG